MILTIAVVTAAFALIVWPHRVFAVANHFAIGVMWLWLGALAAFWIWLAIGVAEAGGIVAILLLCLLFQTAFRRG